MKNIVMGVLLSAVIGCGGTKSEPEPVTEETPDEISQDLLPAIGQFEARLFGQLERGNWIVALGHDPRDCKADEAADFCSSNWLRFADGTRLSIEAAGKYNTSIAEMIFSNTAVTQEEAQPAKFSSECLRDNMRVARKGGWRLAYFDWLFSATTVFLGYNDIGRMDRKMTFDLANGSCYPAPSP